MARTVMELEKLDAAGNPDRAWYGLGLHGSELVATKGLNVDEYLSKLAKLASDETTPS